jgi:[ribosomal protein S5]-alanine N-acetyltransferase
MSVLVHDALGVQRPVQVATGPGPVLSKRMLLRPLADGDRGAFLEAARAGAEALARFLPLHLKDETDDAMFDRLLRLARAGVAGAGPEWLRMIAVLEDGRIAGGFNLNAISRGLEWKADINWWVRSDLTGKGYATEGVAALLAHAFADLPAGLGLHRVDAWITRDNPASRRVAEKAGLRRQGEETSYLLTDSTRWVLHELYSARPAPALGTAVT